MQIIPFLARSKKSSKLSQIRCPFVYTQDNTQREGFFETLDEILGFAKDDNAKISSSIQWIVQRLEQILVYLMRQFQRL